MIKKVLLVVLGFGMITSGIAGITISIVDQKNQVALQQLEKIQEEARTAAAEEQIKLTEKQQEIDRLAMKIEAERIQLQEDRHRLEQHQRSRMAAIEKQMRTATGPKTATRKDYVKGKTEEEEEDCPQFASISNPASFDDRARRFQEDQPESWSGGCQVFCPGEILQPKHSRTRPGRTIQPRSRLSVRPCPSLERRKARSRYLDQLLQSFTR